MPPPDELPEPDELVPEPFESDVPAEVEVPELPPQALTRRAPSAMLLTSCAGVNRGSRGRAGEVLLPRIILFKLLEVMDGLLGVRSDNENARDVFFADQRCAASVDSLSTDARGLSLPNTQQFLISPKSFMKQWVGSVPGRLLVLRIGMPHRS